MKYLINETECTCPGADSDVGDGWIFTAVTACFRVEVMVLTSHCNIALFDCRFEIKHVSGLGNRSPPRGGQEGSAANQQILLSSSEDDSKGVSFAGSKIMPTSYAYQGDCTTAFQH